jgi:hypothetical protein
MVNVPYIALDVSHITLRDLFLDRRRTATGSAIPAGGRGARLCEANVLTKQRARTSGSSWVVSCPARRPIIVSHARTAIAEDVIEY